LTGAARNESFRAAAALHQQSAAVCRTDDNQFGFCFSLFFFLGIFSYVGWAQGILGATLEFAALVLAV
jgi:hypothetical protein